MLFVTAIITVRRVSAVTMSGVGYVEHLCTTFVAVLVLMSTAKCRASEMLDEAFEMVASTSDMGPSSPQAASIFMAHVSVLQRVGLFEKLIQVRINTFMHPS